MLPNIFIHVISLLWHECSDPYDSKQKFNIDIKTIILKHTNKIIMSSQNNMAKESLSLHNHIVWLCSIFITQNIQIMHNPDDKPSNCFILLMFSNLFNFHAIHEREPWT